MCSPGLGLYFLTFRFFFGLTLPKVDSLFAIYFPFLRFLAGLPVGFQSE